QRLSRVSRLLSMGRPTASVPLIQATVPAHHEATGPVRHRNPSRGLVTSSSVWIRLKVPSGHEKTPRSGVTPSQGSPVGAGGAHPTYCRCSPPSRPWRGSSLPNRSESGHEETPEKGRWSPPRGLNG